MFSASLDMVQNNPATMLGLEQLWSFVLAPHAAGAPVQQPTGTQQQPWQHLLVYLHSRSCLSDEIKPHTAEIARSFIDDCMRRMQLAAAEVSSASSARGERDSERVAAEQRISKVLDLLKLYINYNEGTQRQRESHLTGTLRRRPSWLHGLRRRRLPRRLLCRMLRKESKFREAVIRLAVLVEGLTIVCSRRDRTRCEAEVNVDGWRWARCVAQYTIRHAR